MFLTTLKVLAVSFAFGHAAFAAPVSSINIGNGEEPKDLDPQLIIGIAEYGVLQQLFEPLVDLDPVTQKERPGVAEKWTSSKNGMEWTFQLRKNAKWSNGEPVTADDFVYSWTRLLTPELASEYAYFGYFIKNAEKFNTKKITDPKQLGVKAKDKYTLVLQLENPTPYLTKVLYFPSMYPVHKGSIEKHGARHSRPGNLISNGPYVLTKWETNKIITVEKNAHYWDKANVSLESANYFPIVRSDTEEKMFRAGQLNVTSTVPPEKQNFWSEDKTGVFVSDPLLSVAYISFNVKKAPLDDKRVRKALTLAINREQLVKFVTRGKESPAHAFTPPGAGGYHAKKLIATDESQLATAKKLLKEAGFEDPTKFPKIELLYHTNELQKKVCEALQQMWKKNLGIEVGIYNQEWKVYLNTTSKLRDYTIARVRWLGDYDDPNTFLELFHAKSGQNVPGYVNPNYDKLLDASLRESTDAKRFAIFDQMEAILADEAPIAPLYYEKRNYLKSKNIEGWYPSSVGYHPLKMIRLK